MALMMIQASGQRDYYRQMFRNLVHARLGVSGRPGERDLSYCLSVTTAAYHALKRQFTPIRKVLMSWLILTSCVVAPQSPVQVNGRFLSPRK
jgi:hypothetical protein